MAQTLDEQTVLAHAELGMEWAAVDPFTGMAERSTRLWKWAHHNLVVVEGAGESESSCQMAR